ncbi:hypothetical protein MRX96_008306 [Rhipicephalus microplus]
MREDAGRVSPLSREISRKLRASSSIKKKKNREWRRPAFDSSAAYQPTSWTEQISSSSSRYRFEAVITWITGEVACGPQLVWLELKENRRELRIEKSEVLWSRAYTATFVFSRSPQAHFSRLIGASHPAEASRKISGEDVGSRCPPMPADAPAVAASPAAPLGLGWSANGEPATAGRH